MFNYSEFVNDTIIGQVLTVAEIGEYQTVEDIGSGQRMTREELIIDIVEMEKERQAKW